MAIDPWTLYWQGDNLESCVARQKLSDSEGVAAYWQDFANQLAQGSEVLDLACGNGIVAAHLLRVNQSLRITGVDRAEIAPTEFLKDAGILEKVNFRAATDITALPFAENSFDAVTSQFGLEYAPFELASAEAVRMLRPQGRLNLLLHHVDSEILRPAARQLEEIGNLLAKEGIMVAVQKFVDTTIKLEELEATGKRYLESDSVKTKPVSGQIFTGINQVISLLNSNLTMARELVASMQMRLQADRQRLQQMSVAALDEQGIHSHVAHFQALGIPLASAIPFHLRDEDGGQLLIAWQLTGAKA